MRVVDLLSAHAGVVAALHQEGFDEVWSVQSFADLISMPASFGFLALEGEDPAGFILCQGDDVEAEIITIATRLEKRRQGVAHALLRKACQKTRRMFLEVAEDNPVALAFYEKEGFVHSARRKGYYKRQAGGKVDALVMMREMG